MEIVNKKNYGVTGSFLNILGYDELQYTIHGTRNVKPGGLFFFTNPHETIAFLSAVNAMKLKDMEDTVENNFGNYCSNPILQKYGDQKVKDLDYKGIILVGNSIVYNGEHPAFFNFGNLKKASKKFYPDNPGDLEKRLDIVDLETIEAIQKSFPLEYRSPYGEFPDFADSNIDGKNKSFYVKDIMRFIKYNYEQNKGRNILPNYETNKASEQPNLF